MTENLPRAPRHGRLSTGTALRQHRKPTIREGPSGPATPNSVCERPWEGYIDARDYDIVLELEKDARQSDARISRKLGIGEVTVRKRIARLIAGGVLRIVAVPDPWSVGYFMDARIGIRAVPSRIGHILQDLVAMRPVRFVTLTAGRYNILISVNFRSPVELSEFLSQGLAVVEGILRTDTYVTLETKKRRQDILQGDRKEVSRQGGRGQPAPTQPGSCPPPRPGKIDDRDHDIIFELQDDARRSEATLARKLGMNEATVRRRIKRLIRDRVIVVEPVIQPAKVGYVTPAHIGLQLDPSRLDAVLDRVASLPRVHNLVLTAGEFDVLMWATFSSPWDLSHFIKNDLSNIPGVLKTETLINLDIKKMETGILPPREQGGE